MAELPKEKPSGFGFFIFTAQVLENYVTGNDYGARVYCP
jgi:hypothetical protein